MSNRATQEKVTSGGHKFEIYTYVTGLEVEEMRLHYANKMSINRVAQSEDGKVEAGFSENISFDATLETKKYTLRKVVVSLDGVKHGQETSGENEVAKKFDIAEAILNLPNSEYQEIMGEVNELIEPKKGKK